MRRFDSLSEQEIFALAISLMDTATISAALQVGLGDPLSSSHRGQSPCARSSSRRSIGQSR